jgi:cobalt-zinc-cadmium efflux system outer membrane protein
LLIVATLGSVALPGSLHAQTGAAPPAPVSEFIDPAAGLGLEDAVGRALEEEPSLRAVRAEGGAAEGMRHQAQLRPNPIVSFVQQSEPAGTDGQTRIDVQWPLDLFRKPGRIAVAEREAQATGRAIANRERLLAAQVREQYGRVAAAIRELEVTSDLVSATARQRDLVSARVEEGATPALERDILRVELQRLESGRSIQAGRVEQMLIELKRLVGSTPETAIKLREDLEQLVAREGAEPVLAPERAVAGRADVLEAEARVQLAGARVDEALRDGRFDVSLFGMYMRMDAGFPQQGFTSRGDVERVRGVFHYVAGGAMVTVPLRNRNQGGIEAARARRTGAAAELEAVRLTAQAEVAVARTRDEAARQALAAYGAAGRALARQNLGVVTQAYELGRMTLFDVLAEQRRYLDLEVGYTNTLREAYEARQALRQALGAVR